MAEIEVAGEGDRIANTYCIMSIRTPAPSLRPGNRIFAVADVAEGAIELAGAERGDRDRELEQGARMVAALVCLRDMGTGDHPSGAHIGDEHHGIVAPLDLRKTAELRRYGPESHKEKGRQRRDGYAGRFSEHRSAV